MNKLNENNNKAIAILDLAMKISQNSVTDVITRYYGFLHEIDVDIYWGGKNKENYTMYDVPLAHEPRSIEDVMSEKSPDEMLRILEEIWTAAQAKGQSNGQAASES